MEYMDNQEMSVATSAEYVGMSVGAETPSLSAIKVDAVEQRQDEKPYTLRALCAKDIFPMTVIIRKIGLKDIGDCFDSEEIKKIMETANANGADSVSDKAAETVGISVVLKIVDVILENLPAAEQEIFDFMAGLSGMTAVDVGNLPMDVFFEMLIDIFEKKEFVGFMKVVSKFLK